MVYVAYIQRDPEEPIHHYVASSKKQAMFFVKTQTEVTDEGREVVYVRDGSETSVWDYDLGKVIPVVQQFDYYDGV